LLSVLNGFYFSEKVGENNLIRLYSGKFCKKVGYMIFILSLLVILTGFNFFIPLIGPFFPLFQHRRLDIYLIAILIIHVALGAKKVFIRKRMSNGLTNIGIIIVSIAAMSFVFYLDTMR